MILDSSYSIYTNGYFSPKNNSLPSCGDHFKMLLVGVLEQDVVTRQYGRAARYGKTLF